jgi:type IV pilus assembly protein PilB
MRRLCGHCKRPYTPEADTLRAMNISDEDATTLTFYRAVGCEHCNHTGYRGRVGIYELMPVTDSLRRLISQRGTEAQIRDAALAAGMTSIGVDGLAKVKAGVTTPEELLRVVTEVREANSQCPSCSATVSSDFVACPACGHRVGGGCPHCQRPIQSEWKFCPYCARNTDAAPARRPKPRRLRQRGELRELPPVANMAGFKT